MQESLHTLLRRLSEKRKEAHRPEVLEVGHACVLVYVSLLLIFTRVFCLLSIVMVDIIVCCRK